MKIVGIITEYNPFHNGHKRQIEAVRAHFGEEVAIVSLMSGNFVQRGDFALLPKEYRAMMAVKGGADLVLELPYPYSGACAEVFASAGVSILSDIGADYLVFGSESGDIAYLNKTAKNLSDARFEKRLAERAKEQPNRAYALLRDEVYEELFACLPPRKPNDILGVAYLSAIEKLNSNMQAVVVKREGFETATASRAASFASDFESLGKLVPQDSFNLLKNNRLVSMKTIEKAILAFFRLAKSADFESIADLPDGLSQRLITHSKKCTSLEELLEASSTKVYTNARIRRCLLSCFLGVTEEMLHERPAFTRLLGATDRGRAVLNATDFVILTRAGQYKQLDEHVQKQVLFAERADSIYALANENPPVNKPFVVQSGVFSENQ